MPAISRRVESGTGLPAVGETAPSFGSCLRRSDTDRVPLPRHQSLAAHATEAEPEGLDDLGADQAVGRRLAPSTANPSSMAREALRRQTPKVGAVCPNWARTDLMEWTGRAPSGFRLMKRRMVSIW